ncbi:MAG: hypothetical protein K5847_05095 [Lachnospiraceae bacterium]|nr:hypothetical protein [Lachnospiraceae bacterium]
MIAELLKNGAEYPTSNMELQAITGLSHREIVATVSEERKQGTPILSTTKGKGGYFMPDTAPEKARKEIKACIHTIENRAKNSFLGLQTLKREAERLDLLLSGQMELNDV